MRRLPLRPWSKRGARRHVRITGRHYAAFAVGALLLALVLIPFGWPAFLVVAVPAWTSWAATVFLGLVLTASVVFAPLGIPLL
jgi:hypothetical protein